MAYAVIDPDKAPPGGWVFHDPLKGVTFKEWYLRHLIGRVRAFRKANNLPAGPNLRYEVEQILCAERPELCREIDENGKTVKVVRLIKNFAKSSAAFVKASWAQKSLATVDEATFNQRQQTCLSCDRFRNWADPEQGIGYCSECGCAVGKITLKLHWATEQCPIGKWPKTI